MSSTLLYCGEVSSAMQLIMDSRCNAEKNHLVFFSSFGIYLSKCLLLFLDESLIEKQYTRPALIDMMHLWLVFFSVFLLLSLFWLLCNCYIVIHIQDIVTQDTAKSKKKKGKRQRNEFKNTARDILWSMFWIGHGNTDSVTSLLFKPHVQCA